jgi:hypothetical protein
VGDGPQQDKGKGRDRDRGRDGEEDGDSDEGRDEDGDSDGGGDEDGDGDEEYEDGAGDGDTEEQAQARDGGGDGETSNVSVNADLVQAGNEVEENGEFLSINNVVYLIDSSLFKSRSRWQHQALCLHSCSLKRAPYL